MRRKHQEGADQGEKETFKDGFHREVILLFLMLYGNNYVIHVLVYLALSTIALYSCSTLALVERYVIECRPAYSSYLRAW